MTLRRTLDIFPALPLLLTAQCLGVFGNATYAVTVLWWLKTEVGTDHLLALAGTINALPTLLFGLLAGQLADRMDRKTILTLTPLLTAAVLGGVIFTNNMDILLISLLLCGFLMNTALTFEEPALLASFPELTDEHRLEQVNAIHQLLTNAGGIGGALLGGFLASRGVQAGATVALFTALLSFLLVPLTCWPITGPASKVAESQHSLRQRWQQLPEQLQKLLLLVCLFIVLAAPLPNLLPVLTHDVLHKGSQILGQLEATFGIGFVLGGGLTLLGLRPTNLRDLALCIVVAGCVRIGLSVTTTSWIDMVLLVIGGAAVSMGSIASMAQLQKEAPAMSRGAVLGVASTLMAGANPMGLAIATLLLPTFHTLGILQITGVGLILLGTIGMVKNFDS